MTAAAASFPTVLMEGKRAASTSVSPKWEERAPGRSQSSVDQEAGKAKTAGSAESAVWWRRKGEEGEWLAAMEREQQRGIRARHLVSLSMVPTRR